MAKVLYIENETIKIGTDDGKIIEVDRSNFNYDPIVGDLVDIFEDENETIITKAEYHNHDRFADDKDGETWGRVSFLLIFGGLALEILFGSRVDELFATFFALPIFAGLIGLAIGSIKYPNNKLLKTIDKIYSIGSFFVFVLSCSLLYFIVKTLLSIAK